MKPTKEEKNLAGQMFSLYAELQGIGWKEPNTAPKDGTEIYIIEAGSSGIHKAIRDPDGDFWVWSLGDTDISHPILWREK